MVNRRRYVDLIITEAKPETYVHIARHFRRCTISEKNGRRFINLQLPENVQQTILQAYENGKEIRIFA